MCKILDIGSGNLVNPYNIVLTGEDIIHIDIDRKAFHIELVCDAHLLPFKNDSFQIVYASHILEHLENPIQAIREFKRVTQNLVIIKVPNESYYRWTKSSNDHIYGWNKFTLENLLKIEFEKVKIETHNRIYSHHSIPKKIVNIFLTKWFEPNQLIATCRKR